MNRSAFGVERPREVRIAAGLVAGVIAIGLVEQAVQTIAMANELPVAALAVAGAGMLYVGLALNGLFLWGIWTGKALAMQLVRLFYPLGVFVSAMQLVAVLSLPVPWPWVALVCAWTMAQIVLQVFAFIFVGRGASREFFNVICHKCGSTKTRAESFLYTSSTCRACGHSWRHNVRPDRLRVPVGV